MREITKGSFCISIAGHDAGVIYFVVDMSDKASVCDGKIRLLDNLKKKNPKHLKMLSYEDEELQMKLAQGTLRNEDIKYAIKKLSADLEQEVSECQRQTL